MIKTIGYHGKVEFLWKRIDYYIFQLTKTHVTNQI